MFSAEHNRVSSLRLSLPLLVCSAVCVAGLWAWYKNSGSKDGWSTTPLFWMFVLTLAPVLCLIGGIALSCRASRLSWLDRFTMIVAFIVAVPGGFFTLVALNFIIGSL